MRWYVVFDWINSFCESQLIWVFRSLTAQSPLWSIARIVIPTWASVRVLATCLKFLCSSCINHKYMKIQILVCANFVIKGVILENIRNYSRQVLINEDQSILFYPLVPHTFFCPWAKYLWRTYIDFTFDVLLSRNWRHCAAL